MSTYHVTYEPDEGGWWVASVENVPGCHSQGKTIQTARKRIVEALSLFVRDAERAAFVERVKLPEWADRALKLWFELRRQDAERQRQLHDAMQAAAVALVGKMGVGVRDAGEIMSLSHQRVHQLVTAKKTQRPRAKKRRALESH